MSLICLLQKQMGYEDLYQGPECFEQSTGMVSHKTENCIFYLRPSNPIVYKVSILLRMWAASSLTVCSTISMRPRACSGINDKLSELFVMRESQSGPKD